MRLRTRLLVLCVGLVAAFGFAAAASAQNYIVLYKQTAVPADAASTIKNAGGSFVYAYPQIGVAIASSDSLSFRTEMLKDSRIDNVSGTAAYATRLTPDQVDAADASMSTAAQGDLPNAPATEDSLFPLQWDMRQIHTPEAHAITGGSPSVVVGDIDTGLDFTHPDLAANYDPAHSTDCTGGAPAPLLPGNDQAGHGTHTAGTIAAASNGFGITGVAPNVKIAGIRAGNADGFFFPEAVICSFVWAGDTHVDVTNNSYFADPYLFNCRNDPTQRAIWKAEKRAIDYALSQGVTVVAADGNESEDLAHPTMDRTSPDDATPVAREVTNACVVIPVEVNGVVGVSAVGNTRQVDNDNDPNDYLKSYYSSFGVGVTEVTAPGGDFYYGRGLDPGSQVNGLVLSTWPTGLPCGRSVKEDPGVPPFGATTYCWLQGTSMASPHVAGVAALIVSVFGDTSNPKNGKMRPGAVAAYLQQTADPQPCPTEFPLHGAPGTSRANRPYLSQLGTQSGALQECQGGPGYNSWYGNGQVNAFNAITHTSGQ